MRKRPAYFSSFAAVLLTALSVIPFLYVFAKSLLSAQNGFTLSYYYQVFLAQEQYLLRFWKSLGLCLCITAGQVVVSTLAGYGFAKCRLPGKNVLFFLLMVLMIMPLQVTLVPNEIIEAARLDGCGTLKLICRIAVPMNRAGLICTLLLSFLDGWNMVEQPMVYLEDFGRYPISVALASVPPENPTVQLVCCILVALPPLFLFAYFNRELVEGIALGGEK